MDFLDWIYKYEFSEDHFKFIDNVYPKEDFMEWFNNQSFPLFVKNKEVLYPFCRMIMFTIVSSKELNKESAKLNKKIWNALIKEVEEEKKELSKALRSLRSMNTKWLKQYIRMDEMEKRIEYLEGKCNKIKNNLSSWRVSHESHLNYYLTKLWHKMNELGFTKEEQAKIVCTLLIKFKYYDLDEKILELKKNDALEKWAEQLQDEEYPYSKRAFDLFLARIREKRYRLMK